MFKLYLLPVPSSHVGAVEPGLNPAGNGKLGQGMDLTQLHGGLGLDQRLPLGQHLLILLHLGSDNELVLEGAGQRGIDIIHALSAGLGHGSAVSQTKNSSF